MTIWELRQAIESNIPVWAWIVAVVLALIVLIVIRATNRGGRR